jgi:hypothetical protein
MDFGKIQVNKQGYIKVGIKVSYQHSHIDILLSESKTSTYVSTTEGNIIDNYGIIEKLCFEKNLETNEPLEKKFISYDEYEMFNKMFKLVIRNFSSEYFKETKYFKMRCLYDDEFKNKFD